MKSCPTISISSPNGPQIPFVHALILYKVDSPSPQQLLFGGTLGPPPGLGWYTVDGLTHFPFCFLNPINSAQRVSPTHISYFSIFHCQAIQQVPGSAHGADQEASARRMGRRVIGKPHRTGRGCRCCSQSYNLRLCPLRECMCQRMCDPSPRKPGRPYRALSPWRQTK